MAEPVSDWMDDPELETEPRPAKPIVGAVDQDPKNRLPMMPGQSTDLDERYSQMAMSPEQFTRAREVLLQFIKNQLTEAQYDDKGYPTQVNDYYVVPGSDKKALSRKGADALSDLYKYKIARMDEVRSTVEKDYCSITYKCTLHRSNMVVAERDATVSSAEKSMQRSAKKYTLSGKKDPDWRGAENDIRAKAQKRAFVQAVIHACNASDILAAADDLTPHPVEEVEYEVVDTGAEALYQRMQSVLETCLEVKVLTKDEVKQFVDWANKPGRKHEKIEEQIVLLEDRLAAADEDKGPF